MSDKSSEIEEMIGKIQGWIDVSRDLDPAGVKRLFEAASRLYEQVEIDEVIKHPEVDDDIVVEEATPNR